MTQCANCDDLDKRMLKWLDHIGCTPTKAQRYDQLMEVMTVIANEGTPCGTDHLDLSTLRFINQAAKNILKEFTAHELLRSNGNAKVREESNQN